MLQHLADGLLTGAIVALGAIGLTLTMRILRFANFSHSELLTLGAYTAFVFYGFMEAVDDVLGGAFEPFSFGWALIFATLGAGLLTALAALLIDRLIFSRLRSRAGEMTLVFASFGVALLIRNLLLLFFGHDPKYFSNEIQIAVKIAPGLRVLPDQVFVFVLTLVLVVLLHWFLSYSRTGIAMRGVAENPALAQVNGVDVSKIVRWTWLIGASGAAMAGVLYGLTVQIRPELGFNLILPLFAAAILGGTGSVYGAVIGGFIVGLAENLSVMIIPASYKPAVPFLLILLILYLKPAGLFGDNR